MAQQFLQKYVGCEDKGESHTEDQGQGGWARLGGGGHQGPVIETEQEAAGEEGEETTIEYLGYQDHVSPVNWEQLRSVWSLYSCHLTIETNHHGGDDYHDEDQTHEILPWHVSLVTTPTI